MDPVTLEVIKGAIRSARQEMATLIERTSMSQSIREKLDYFAAIFDRNGRMVSGTDLPLGANIIDVITEHYPPEDMRPGDLYWYNDCYASRGGVSHSPDLVLIAPVFYEGNLVAFSEAWGHLQDIGGLAPGSNSPLSTEIYHEGIIMPPTRLEREGIRNEELFQVFVRNSRYPDTLKGDVRALIAAVRLGETRIKEICERFGKDVAMSAFECLIEQTCEGIRQFVDDNIPDGIYSFEDWLDGDVYQDRSFAIRLTLTKKKDNLSFDFTKSDNQCRGTLNFIMDESVPKLMLGVYAMSYNPTLLTNDGCCRALGQVHIREGSILDPKFPAPLGQRTATWLRVNSCLFGAIGKASKGRVPASSPYMAIVTYRWPKDNPSQFGFAFDGLAIGHGARPFADGHDAIFYIGQRDMPVEYSELEFPFRVEQYAIHMDSGGPGKFRGGCGIIRDYRILRDGLIARHTMDNVLYPPWGVAGGDYGRPGRFILNPDTPSSKDLPAKGDNLKLLEGDVLRAMTCGGGGWGNPYERDPLLVLDDTRCGMVSREAAQTDYGVIIDEDMAMDKDATSHIRKEVPL